MKHLEFYTGDKTYMFPNGTLATPEIMTQQFPAIAAFIHVIETDDGGEVCFAVQNFRAMRTLYEIDNTLSNADALVALEAAINTVPEEEPSAEERIAAALEYQNLLSM